MLIKCWHVHSKCFVRGAVNMKGPGPSRRCLGACLDLSSPIGSKLKETVSSPGDDGALMFLLPSQAGRLASPYFTGHGGAPRKVALEKGGLDC